MKQFVAALAALLFIIALAFPAQARLICGLRQMQYYGIHDPAYKLARNWLRFPHTSPHPGAVVVFSRGHDGRSGHVARIQSVLNNCTAVVTDEKGTYTRNICHRQLGIVDPSGNSVRLASHHRHYRHYSRSRSAYERQASYRQVRDTFQYAGARAQYY